MENIEKKLGTVVKWLRQKSGMTQDKLAQLLTAGGIPTKQNTVAKLEAGLRPTSVAEFGVLANIFGLSVPELAEAVFPSSDADQEIRSASLAVREEQVEVLGLRLRLAELQSQIEAARSELSSRELYLDGLRNRLDDLMQQAEMASLGRDVEGT